VLLLAIAGCAASPAADSQHFMSSLPGNARVVMMPPDIRYYLMTAGGNPELHEAWTADAESAFANAVDSIADMRGISIEVVARTALSEDALRFEGLHAALGEALIKHVVGGTPLPAKDGNDISDWTMGPGVHVIREETGADYALFIHYRENQPSGSRLAFAILAAASDVVIPTGSEHGFATLVNLDSGNIEWFGMLFDEGNELREEAGSAVIAEWLLEELPLGSGSFADALEAK
jgi:hypothetical protein